MPNVDSSLAQGTPAWVELSTSNGDDARAFYTALFGWEYVGNPMGPDMTYYIAKVGGRDVAGVWQQVPGIDAGNPPTWSTYFAVDNVDAVAEKVVAAGGAIVSEPMDVPGAGRMVAVTDPTGAAVSFWQKGEHTGFGVVNEPGAWIWSELITNEPAKAISFYEDVLGITTKTEPFGEMGDYTQFMVNGDGKAGLMKAPANMADHPSTWSVYFYVTDAEATAAKTADLGGAVANGPFALPGIGRMAVLKDPQGAYFCVLEPNAELS